MVMVTFETLALSSIAEVTPTLSASNSFQKYTSHKQDIMDLMQ